MIVHDRAFVYHTPSDPRTILPAPFVASPNRAPFVYTHSPIRTLLAALTGVALAGTTLMACASDSTATPADDTNADVNTSPDASTDVTSGNDTNTADAGDGSTASPDPADGSTASPDPELPPLPESWTATADDFDCLTRWQPVRGFYLTNVLGREELALQIANDGFQDQLPPGTIIQLVPQEAMVKLLPGTNPETGDWEYFNLTVDENGTNINQRGGAEVSNPAGSCLSCHAGAIERDYVCEATGLCAAAAVPRNIVDALVQGDPRCD
jgi:hypothetical protein